MPESLESSHEAERLGALRSYEILDTPAEPAFDDFAELAARLTGMPMAVISFADERRHWFKARTGFAHSETETRREIAVFEHPVRAGAPLSIPDLAADERFADDPLVTQGSRFRAYAGAPLIDDAGFVLGTLCVFDTKRRELDANQHLALRILSRSIVDKLGLRRRLAVQIRLGSQREELIEELRTQWDDAPCGSHVADAAGVIREINRTELRWLGYARSDVIGRFRTSDLVAPEHHPVLVLAWDKLKATGELQRAQVDLMCRGGARLPITVVSRAARDATGALASVHSITMLAAPDREGEETKRLVLERDLHRARRDREDSEARHAVDRATKMARTTELEELLDKAGVGTWSYEVGAPGMSFSPALERLVGLPPGAFDGTRAMAMKSIHPEDLLRTQAQGEKAIFENSPRPLEFRVVHPDGTVRWLTLPATVTRDEAGRPRRVSGLALDATERTRLTADSTRARQSELAILESLTDGFIGLDRQWRYTHMNQRAGQLLGRDAPSMIGKHIWTEFPEGVEPFQRAYEKVMADRVPVTLIEHFQPWNRWFENRVYPSEGGISIFFQDVTVQMEREQHWVNTESRLQTLARRLNTAREEEAARLAREIHDGMGQTLTAIKMDLAWIERRLAGNAPVAETIPRIKESRALIDSAIGSVRRIATELRPAVLDDLDLTEAIRSQAEQFEERSGLPCSIDAPSARPQASKAAATALFRILQECLTNVARHANATSVRLRLRQEGSDLTLEVEDDGVGISDEAIVNPRSIGLFGMTERARELGGRLEVRRAAPRGTVVSATVPRGA